MLLGQTRAAERLHRTDRNDGREGHVRLGGIAALDLRAGNEMTWAVVRVRW